MIKQLSKQVTEQLCAQQVITSICDIVKQLVDNSIDAGATKIDIVLEQYGKNRITVADDGCGIGDFQQLGSKGATSKNQGNYQEVSTLGFRGQALHSISKISRKMSITSTTKSSKTKQYNLKTNQQSILHPQRAVGTCVQIQSIFQYLPVRRYELLNKYKQFFKKIHQMIKEYCIIYYHIVFMFRNVREGREDVVIQTYRHQKEGDALGDPDREKMLWYGRVEEMLGTKIAESLIYLDTQHLKGWILKNIESGSSRQNTFIRKNIFYLFLNSRPIEPLTKIISTLDEVYKKYNRSTKYLFIINLILPWESYDVNLTPNKREIFIKETLVNMILEELKKFIDKNVIQIVPALKDFESKQKGSLTQYLSAEPIQQKQSCCGSSQKHEKQQKPETPNSSIPHKYHPQPSNPQPQKPNPIKQPSFQQNPVRKSNIARQQKLQRQNKQYEENRNQIYQRIHAVKQKQQMQMREKIDTKKAIVENSLIRNLNQRMSMGSKKSQIKFHGTEQKFDVRKQQKQPQIYNKKQQKTAEAIVPLTGIPLPNPPLSNSSTISSAPLTLPQPPNAPTLSTSSFSNFIPLGQFNHGFILCLFDHNFYLVDQHAASQKTLFQKYLANSGQPLNRSQIGQKIPVDVIEMESIQTRKKELEEDGFRFEIGAKEVFLAQGPVVNGKLYGKECFMELAIAKKRITEYQEYYSNMASKACRSAVMVGDVLQLNQMKNIVNQLSSLNSPWNCPHGRPTLIYLGQRNQLISQISDKNRQYSLL